MIIIHNRLLQNARSFDVQAAIVPPRSVMNLRRFNCRISN